jgi:hypothetical protein
MEHPLSRELRKRLPRRDELSHTDLAARYWPDADLNDVLALFNLLEEELTMPAGLLRPEDDLDHLLAPFSLRKPLLWFQVEPHLEEATSEVNYQLKQRMKATGSRWSRQLRIHTLDGLVRAWCALPPSTSA